MNNDDSREDISKMTNKKQLQKTPLEQFVSEEIFKIVKVQQETFIDIVRTKNTISLLKFFSDSYNSYIDNLSADGYKTDVVNKTNDDTDADKWNVDIYNYPNGDCSVLLYIPIEHAKIKTRVVGIIISALGDGYYYCMVNKKGRSDVMRNNTFQGINKIGKIKIDALMNRFRDYIIDDFYLKIICKNDEEHTNKYKKQLKVAGCISFILLLLTFVFHFVYQYSYDHREEIPCVSYDRNNVQIGDYVVADVSSMIKLMEVSTISKTYNTEISSKYYTVCETTDGNAFLTLLDQFEYSKIDDYIADNGSKTVYGHIKRIDDDFSRYLNNEDEMLMPDFTDIQNYSLDTHNYIYDMRDYIIGMCGEYQVSISDTPPRKDAKYEGYEIKFFLAFICSIAILIIIRKNYIMSTNIARKKLMDYLVRSEH